MLINCPRCGFSQPQDQYCAQCGVDMQSFKPKEAPFLSQLLKSTAFQVGVLIVAALFMAQYILNGPAPQKLVQKIIRSQGITKSERSSLVGDNDAQERAPEFTGEKGGTTQALTETSSVREAAVAREAVSESGTATANAAVASHSGLSDAPSVSFKLSYIELPIETVTKWVVDSSNLGLYQGLADYSVGILYDFHKRNENQGKVLKTAELKLIPGAPNTNLSGVMSDDGTQLIGLAATIELKSQENESLFGNINISKNSRQGADNYPSEFELPKGSAFFMIGTLKVENFQTDRARLQMPPFQIFKSNDFMTRKTEFVIILEPDYK